MHSMNFLSLKELDCQIYMDKKNGYDVFKGKNILITGGTGSLGKALTKKLLELDVRRGSWFL